MTILFPIMVLYVKLFKNWIAQSIIEETMKRRAVVGSVLTKRPENLVWMECKRTFEIG